MEFYPHTCHICGETFGSPMLGSLVFDAHVQSHLPYDLEDLFMAQEAVGNYDCLFTLDEYAGH